MSEQLKPCPFCGERGMITIGANGMHFATCEACPIELWATSKAKAIAAWNRRTEPRT